MDLEVLKYIVDNNSEYIEQRVDETKYDPATAVNIGKLILEKDGDIGILSDKQKFYFQKFIEPLIENVPCEGIYGKETCTGNGIIDKESLMFSYSEDNFLCQHCRYDTDKHDTE